MGERGGDYYAIAEICQAHLAHATPPNSFSGRRCNIILEELRLRGLPPDPSLGTAITRIECPGGDAQSDPYRGHTSSFSASRPAGDNNGSIGVNMQEAAGAGRDSPGPQMHASQSIPFSG